MERGVTLVKMGPAFDSTSQPRMRPGGVELTERAMELCAFRPGAVVVDIGSGPLETVGYLRECYKVRAVGLDPDGTLLAAGLRRRPGLDVVRGVAESLPFRSDSLDGVLFECVLSLVFPLEKALDEAARVLKPGGRLVVHDLFATEETPGASGEGGTGRVRTAPEPLPQERMERILADREFSIEAKEDHSRALKLFVAERLLAGAPLFDCMEGGRGSRSMCGTFSVTGRPAYCLLIARKSRA